MKRIVLAAVVGLAVLAIATPASAHVTVSAPGATQGGDDQVITFRVPTESVSASTVKLAVKFPTSTPIASVLVAPHVGWTSKVVSVKLAKPIVTDDGDITDAVSQITWTANSKADGIKPGQFDQFVVIAGLLPKTPALTFPAVQTYSDGTVVSWIEQAAPGSSDEPDHPAPVLSLAAAGAGATGSTATTSKKSGDAAAVGLAIAALVVAAGALGLGVVSRAKAGKAT